MTANPAAAAFVGIVLTMSIVVSGAGRSRADEAGLSAIAAGRHVIMIRHGLTTPGSGDPLGFRLDDCATQRNLIDDGREESRKLGRLLHGRNTKIDRVLSSEWCRCLETAALIDAGRVEKAVALNNLFGRPQNRDAQVGEMRKLIEGWSGPGNLLLVTHGANMGALMGINPETAAGVVLAPEPGSVTGFRVVGRISPDG
jgi:phosphohistidine phosphatase SixA